MADENFDIIATLPGKPDASEARPTARKKLSIPAILSIAIVAAVIVFLCVFPYIRGYHITYENGSFYMVGTGPVYQENLGCNFMSIEDITFQSFREMRMDILLGNFTDRERIMIDSYVRNGARFKLPDIVDPYEPTYPENCTGYSVSLVGEMYYFQIDANAMADHISVDLNTESQWQKSVSDIQYYLYEYPADRQERDAVVYHESPSQDTGIRHVIYEINVGEKLLYVEELYDPAISDSVPYQIDIYGKDHGQYFKVSVEAPTERPTVQWLSAFGII